MPIANSNGFNIITPDYNYSKKYWPLVTEYVKNQYQNIEITDAPTVQSVLKECFKIFELQFMNLIEGQRNASYYMFVHSFHENSCELWFNQINGIEHNIDELAIIRRVFKIILEQSCGLVLNNAISFNNEMVLKRGEYTLLTEELLYIGNWAITLSDFIAKSQLFPNSIGLQVIGNDLNILTYSPGKYVFDYIEKDIPKHNEYVVVSNNLNELKSIWNNIGVDYNVLASYHTPSGGLLVAEDFINQISEKHNYDKRIVQSFYGGLTVSKTNKLSFEDCIIRNQDINRYIYRAILKLNIENVDYYIIGKNKFREGLIVMSYNALPFGFCPDEWAEHEEIKGFVKILKHDHDKTLEDPAVKALTDNNLCYDRNINSLKTLNKSQNISLLFKGMGEIDILYIDTAHKTVYVCECKHNRSRFDMFNWRRDYVNFKEIYEQKLSNKTTWVEKNLSKIFTHMEITYGVVFETKEEYKVEGIFLINAPTIYMYDSLFETFTLFAFNKLVEGSYSSIEFVFEDEVTGDVINVKQPYFTNLTKALKKEL